jgi:predicted transcriptional regulator
MRKLFILGFVMFTINAFAVPVALPLEKINPDTMVSIRAKTLQDMLQYVKDLQKTIDELSWKLHQKNERLDELEDKCTF